jgi:hypothetical protein
MRQVEAHFQSQSQSKSETDVGTKLEASGCA